MYPASYHRAACQRKNALRILLSHLLASPSPLSLSPRIPHRTAPSSSTARPHPGLSILFLPALHPILYLISAAFTSRGPTLRHCVVRCPPISSCASGERSRGCGVCGHTSLSACRVIRELLPPSPAQLGWDESFAKFLKKFGRFLGQRNFAKFG
jgi:hypothetical protein